MKSILAQEVGFDAGWFYDLLVANAYMTHLSVCGGSFSDGQIADIKNYFTNQTCIDLLLAESAKKLPPTYFNQKATPNVPKEKLLDAIVSQYKGTVLFIDFWATWCLPCLRAMETAKPLKEIMQNQNVVFVYITDASSDYSQWEAKAPAIGGEHYWISIEEGGYIRRQLNITGIPAYAIYDASGQLCITFGSYPGTAVMQQAIEKLLTNR
jgi:thiol-disulfide isomerase/thioredoxin